LGLPPSTYEYDEYKNDVGVALISHFGEATVERGNKAFDIKAPSRSVEADVVPCFEYREYKNFDGRKWPYESGTALVPDDDINVVSNFPDQQYENGVTKNDNTYRKYKRTVRILKRLRNHLIEAKKLSEDLMPSFLLESALWNIENSYYSPVFWVDTIDGVLEVLMSRSLIPATCKHWREVNGIKLLFSEESEWTNDNLFNFAQACLHYTRK